jgi:hypothetical protein
MRGIKTCASAEKTFAGREAKLMLNKQQSIAMYPMRRSWIRLIHLWINYLILTRTYKPQSSNLQSKFETITFGLLVSSIINRYNQPPCKVFIQRNQRSIRIIDALQVSLLLSVSFDNIRVNVCIFTPAPLSMRLAKPANIANIYYATISGLNKPRIAAFSIFLSCAEIQLK